ncbi:MAG: RNA-directed DNA polymerase [bacterium]|nr:RNA-directed DNA polymerase [bacterium]
MKQQIANRERKPGTMYYYDIKALKDSFTELAARAPKRLHGISCGIDAVTIEAFNQNLFHHLDAISAEIRSPRGYRFDRLKTVLIPKPNGKERLISIPTIRDRVVQKSLLNYLQNNTTYASFNGVSYGFTRGKSTGDAIHDAIEFRNTMPFVYKTDIQSFFDSIDRKILEAVILEKIKDTSVHRILFRALNCEIERVSGAQWRKIQKLGIKIGTGLRQGMPLSPFFANLILLNFDRRVKESGYSMIRYADDLIFLSKNYETCLKIHNFCKIELGKVALTVPEPGLPETKTFIHGPEETAEFLGVGICRAKEKQYRAIITDEQKRRINEKIYQYADINTLSRRGIFISTYFKKLDSIKAGYLAAYSVCDNEILATFENQLNQWINGARLRLLQKGLGIDVKNMTPQQLQFIELTN